MRPCRLERSCVLIPEPRLRELCFGKWEGLTYSEIQARQPGLLQRWENDLEFASPPDGESLLQLTVRVEAMYHEILSAHPGGSVVLVAHGGPLKLLMARALGMPAARFLEAAAFQRLALGIERVS